MRQHLSKFFDKTFWKFILVGIVNTSLNKLARAVGKSALLVGEFKGRQGAQFPHNLQNICVDHFRGLRYTWDSS